MPKEEVEGAATDAGAATSKDKSKAPTKKGASEAVTELTPEEEARLKKERQEREKQNALLMEEWSKLPLDEQFYRYAEDKQQEPYITYPAGEGEGAVGGVEEITLSLQALKELENNVNDPSRRGVNIRIDKLIAAAAETDAKSKAPAKGKAPAAAAGGEESKPISGEAWLDLTPFMYAGVTESAQRVFVSTYVDEENKPDAENDENKSQHSQSGADSQIF
jgi:hypothetical protein